MEPNDDVLIEIGRIAVRAAGIEDRIAHLAEALSRGELSADGLVTKPSSVAREALSKAAALHEDVALGEDVQAWLNHVLELLLLRHSIIHAEWVSLTNVADGSDISAALHTKSASMIPADYIVGLKLPQRLLAAWQEGGALLQRAYAP